MDRISPDISVIKQVMLGRIYSGERSNAIVDSFFEEWVTRSQIPYRMCDGSFFASRQLFNIEAFLGSMVLLVASSIHDGHSTWLLRDRNGILFCVRGGWRGFPDDWEDDDDAGQERVFITAWGVDCFREEHLTVFKAAGLRETLDDVSSSRVPVVFAYATNQGAFKTNSSFTMSPLDSIRENYTSEVRQKIDDLIVRLKEEKHGLIVLHGPTGTGKTYLNRSLLSEMKGIRTGVVCNPPTKFLSEMNLMLDVLRGEKNPLIILEDVGEIFQEQSKHLNVDLFASLANLTDGLQSLLSKAIFVLTFNYDISQADPALIRPGRCIANIHVPELSFDDACALLPMDKREALLGKKKHSLAEVYAIKNDVGVLKNLKNDRKVGFTA